VLVNLYGSNLRLGRLKEARRALDQMKGLEISDLEVRLNAEFCEPVLLIEEGKYEEGLAAFAAMLNRHSEAFKDPEYRYLYEDIQRRRAIALFGLSRYKEALPLLREAVSFSFDRATDEQDVHFYLGVILDDTNETEAKQEFLRVVGFGLKNDIEEQARWRLAILHYKAGALAQAMKQLETILLDFPSDNPAVPREQVNEFLSRIKTWLAKNR